jgi:MFS family permease
MGDQSSPRLSGVAVFFCVFLPFALGHYLSSLVRNVNAVLAPQLVGALALTPGQLGLLTSAFFFAAALVQLPVGMALDRYGPRKVQMVLMTCGATGALMFAYGQSFGQLLFARTLIGLGLGGCFMSAVKSVATWVAPARLPSVQGYLIAVGGLGAASSTMPVTKLLQYMDWRGLFVLMAALIACCGLLIRLVSPPTVVGNAKPPTLKSILDVYRHPSFRSATSLVVVSHMVFFGIQGLWIGRWLSDVARFPEPVVAYLLYMGMASVIFGAIAVGMITEWAGKRGIAPLDVAAIGVGLFVLIQVAIVFNWKPSMQLLSVVFTLAGTITGIEFAIVSQSMPKELTGRAATCLNLVIFVGAFLVQAGFGQLVGLWTPDAANHYPARAYQVAFGVLVLLQLPGLVGYFLRRRPLQCEIAILSPKEDYEIGTLRSPR